MTQSHGTATSTARNDLHGWGSVRRGAALMLATGFALWFAALMGFPLASGWLAFGLCYGLIIAGAIIWTVDIYRGTTAGIKNHGTYHRHVQRRGIGAVVLWIAVMGFYTSMYWYPSALTGAIRLVDPLSQLLRNGRADQYFLYSFLYTIAVLVMGFRMLLRYRHSAYQRWRTLSLMFCQLIPAFLLPSLLRYFNHPEFYFTYFWPLDATALYPDKVRYLLGHPGGLGALMFFWSTVALVVATPLLTWRWGKRWYCSWVCGCGGLAETAGDPFRHLSSKTLAAWRFERWSIHLVLVVITAGTILLWANEATEGAVLGAASFQFKRAYGFVVASVLAGVVGTSFYFVMGNRIWCRFFCPMAAILGIFQRYLSRFRITTNGSQCMSCGNCSTYCEMGINVRSYAQRGANIVRASCVGCGICSSVCPRGVLNLECGSTHTDRFPGADAPVQDLLRSLKR